MVRAANPCCTAARCESLVLVHQSLSSFQRQTQQRQSARIAKRQSMQVRAKCRNCVRCPLAGSGVRRVFAVPPGVLHVLLPVLTVKSVYQQQTRHQCRDQEALVPPSHRLRRDPPFAVSGPNCSPREGQMKQSRLHSCKRGMLRQRPAELSEQAEGPT